VVTSHTQKQAQRWEHVTTGGLGRQSDIQDGASLSYTLLPRTKVSRLSLSSLSPTPGPSVARTAAILILNGKRSRHVHTVFSSSKLAIFPGHSRLSLPMFLSQVVGYKDDY
jgi:hypothetical protein